MIDTSLKAENLFLILQKALIDLLLNRYLVAEIFLIFLLSGFSVHFSSPAGSSTLIWHPYSIDIAQELPPVTLACSLGINLKWIELILQKIFLNSIEQFVESLAQLSEPIRIPSTVMMFAVIRSLILILL